MLDLTQDIQELYIQGHSAKMISLMLDVPLWTVTVVLSEMDGLEMVADDDAENG